ncbi:MAG TPA: SDR family NAD(P)-dependent oxidoreductase, partial [Gammaproteobacteria bacterium]|nr:SDR family NAD(P)-dependent oxidoreductase [Gammaproteobacteria bacterium]
MDLGIKGKKAIVCASSKGLGKACATSLVQEGVDVVINSRNEIDLKEIQTELSFLEAGKVDYVV